MLYQLYFLWITWPIFNMVHRIKHRNLHTRHRITYTYKCKENIIWRKTTNNYFLKKIILQFLIKTENKIYTLFFPLACFCFFLGNSTTLSSISGSGSLTSFLTIIFILPAKRSARSMTSSTPFTSVEYLKCIQDLTWVSFDLIQHKWFNYTHQNKYP